MSSQILIVEDDEAIREMMAFSLTQADFQVIKADSGFMALQQLQQQRPDLVVIDWGLPDFSGLELLSIIRRDEVLRELPLIMLTARAEERDKIKGLEYGADDYLIKPVSVQELIARIKAHLRRARGFQKNQSLSYHSIRLDVNAHRVWVDDQLLTMSLTEFKLLKLLLENSEKLLSRERILNHVWGYDARIEDRTVDVHILRLRKALKPFNKERWIKTVRGIGYQLFRD
ncbi:phosphate regulon transcriptional regulatory protein PhoB [Marinicella pacifica]|uniref:Phosphate regulon transcriptional regulatory protein PhoB n=1 Tax=Marinicella pacifica TaxID=1171543 RepID=A0A917FJI0_9GAMM|nr:response regulator [Marinicella pacifica]GGF84499.1 phosphate regulon transcriptional regulatory protein PhoB [Marinicella pacifica]